MGSGTVILTPVVIQDGYGGNLLRIDNDQRVLTDSSVSATVLPPDAATESTQATLLTEAEFEARVGEVQTTPTSNTILGRLKDFTDSIAARLGVLGQSNMDGSTPVVIANDQSHVDISVHDGYNVPISSTDSAGGSRLNVNAHVSSSVLPPDAATESTQATLLTEADFDTRIGEVSPTPTANTVLGRLKDITDSLAARLGTLGQKEMTGSTPVVIASDQSNVDIDLHDGYSAPISSVYNNDINRLESRSSITSADGTQDVTVETYNNINRLDTRSSITNEDGDKTVTIIDDITDSAQKRLLVEADFKPGANIQVSVGPAADSGVTSDFLLNAGSEDMIVNGSVTPVTFSYAPQDGYDIQLTSLRLVSSANSFVFDGSTFGKGGGALTNGVTIDIVANEGTFVEQLAVLKVNEDFVRLLSFDIAVGTTSTVLAASLPFGGNVILHYGSGDSISMTINDNLTTAARSFNYLTGTIYGIVQID